MSQAAKLTRERMRRVARNAARASARESDPAPPPTRKEARYVPVGEEHSQHVPDLLHAQPALRVDAAGMAHTLSFVFLTGAPSGSLAAALSQAGVAPSDWSAENFADALFIDELIDSCFTFTIAGKNAPLDRKQLRRLLCAPPRDSEHVAVRQAVLAELAGSPQLVAALERVYQSIVTLLALVDDEGADARLDVTQWRVDVLTALRDAIAALDGSFAASTTALVRLARFGTHVRQSEAWQRLCALLDFEADSARAQLQVSLGADGGIRTLDIVSLQERTDSVFYVNPVRRLLRRLLLWLQGYRIGARDVVERWFEQVFNAVRAHIPTLLQLKCDLEFYLGTLHFKALAERKGLAVCLPTLLDPSAADGGKTIRALFNPLLLAQRSPPVAADLHLPSPTITCITTGPNSGGKTRFLQALSFCQLLAQAGCFVPAESATLRRASGLFVSLGEHAAADQEEGRLGMELVRIRRVFESSHPGALIVLDELCSGTNPSEGEQIFRMLLELLHEVGHEVHITTHFLSFAERLTPERDLLGLHFLQVELDPTQVPTYRFTPGVATTSLAHQTAQRLGVTRDQLRALLKR